MTENFQFFQNLDLEAFKAHCREKRGGRLPSSFGGRRSFAHMERGDLDKLSPGLKGIRLAGVSEPDIDRLVADIFSEMPWMAGPLKAIHQGLIHSTAQNGHCHFKPILLVGPPGVSKSHLARKLAGKLGLLFASLDVGTGTEAWKLTGMSRGWSNAHSGRPLDTILESGVGNPVILLDELDMAATQNDRTTPAISVFVGLLGLLEPISSREWECPYFQLSFDMRQVNWVVTANTTRDIPAPLLSRFEVLHIQQMSASDLMIAARAEGDKRDLHPDDIELLKPLLDQYPTGHPSLNMRKMLRLLDQVEGVVAAPRLN